jgi:hypothetical protein
MSTMFGRVCATAPLGIAAKTTRRLAASRM